MLAANALAEGLDSPSLRELAGQSKRDTADVGNLLFATLRELNEPIPTDEQEVLWRLVRDEAQSIVSGYRNPQEGASWISHTLYNRVDAEGDLRVFVGLSSQLEDHPEDRSYLENEIIEASKEIMAREKPRTWIKVQAIREGFPLWNPRWNTPVRPGDLPLSYALLRRLNEWQVHYDGTFDSASDERSGFASSEHAQVFVAEGRKIVDAMQDELGVMWHVEYMPEPYKPPGLRLANSRGQT